MLPSIIWPFNQLTTIQALIDSLIGRVRPESELGALNAIKRLAWGVGRYLPIINLFVLNVYNK